MSSLRAFIALTFLALTQLSTTSPVSVEARALCLPDPPLPTASPNTLPAAPPSGQSFQYVALGRGVQNYTCADASSVPVAQGAVATLYDGTDLAYFNEGLLNALPQFAVYFPLEPLPAQLSSLLVLGHHFFGADGTPTFDLTKVGKILYAAKAASQSAPSNANAGPAGTGAVSWLELTAKPGKPSVGLQTVYRVVTAGGNPPSKCSSAGTISVQYAAEYWFYN